MNWKSAIPLLAVMQGVEFASFSNSFTPSKSSFFRPINRAFPHEPSLKNIRRFGFERDTAGDCEFHFCSCRCAAVDVQAAANSLRPLAHPFQSTVSSAIRAHHLWVNAAPAIPYKKAKFLVLVVEFDFDILRPRVPNSVDQRLPADAIHSITKDRVLRACLTADDQTIPSVIGQVQFIANSRKRLLQISSRVRRGAHAADRVASFVDHSSHQFQNTAERLLCGRIFRQTVGNDMELHRSAQESLQQRIVQFLRNLGALCQPFLEHTIEMRPHLVQSQAIERQHSKTEGRDDTEAKPPGLPKKRCNLQSDDRFLRVPNAVCVAGDHSKTV